jgi:hypothetical protein
MRAFQTICPNIPSHIPGGIYGLAVSNNGAKAFVHLVNLDSLRMSKGEDA